MKRFLGLFLIFIVGCNFINAKVKIQGNIDGYSNKEIFVYTYLNNNEILSQKINTDASGNFNFETNDNYQGIVRLFLPISKVNSIIFVNDNTIKFKAKPQSTFLNYTEMNDEANNKFNQYNKVSDYQERVSLLNDLKKKYNPSDEFYQNIVKEEARLKKESDIDFTGFPFVKYYVDLEKNYLKYEPKNDKDILRVANEVLDHLANDNEDLEKTHLMNQLLNVYLTYSVNQYNTSEEQIAGIRKTIDKALDATIIETSRGQNVLLGFIQILKGYGLDYMADDYVEKANALTCTITDGLKSTLNAEENTKIGATFQNFDFPTPQKQGKSLYDIKTKYKLIIFWGSFCPHCQEEKPMLKAFYPEFKAQGGEIIAFGIETTPTEFQNFTKGLDWINDSDYLFWSSPIVAKYGIEGTPTMFLLDENNVIVAKAAKLSLIQENIK